MKVTKVFDVAEIPNPHFISVRALHASEQAQFEHLLLAGGEEQKRHVVKADYPGASEHEGYPMLASPTTAMCEPCHVQEVSQFHQSRHSLPAYVAVAGSQELSA